MITWAAFILGRDIWDTLINCVNLLEWRRQDETMQLPSTPIYADLSIPYASCHLIVVAHKLWSKSRKIFRNSKNSKNRYEMVSKIIYGLVGGISVGQILMINARHVCILIPSTFMVQLILFHVSPIKQFSWIMVCDVILKSAQSNLNCTAIHNLWMNQNFEGIWGYVNVLNLF